MTGFDSIIAAIAMVPAALNPSLAVQDKTLNALVCGSGQAVSIPLGKPDLPGSVPTMCCAKGCQSKQNKLRKAQKLSVN